MLGENISKSWLSRPHPPYPKTLQVMRQEVLPLRGATGYDMGKQDSLPDTPSTYIKIVQEKLFKLGKTAALLTVCCSILTCSLIPVH